MTLLQTLGTVVAGTFVGLDLASVPQAMYSRPLVAGLLGGLIVGRPFAGLAIGAFLELFALDTLPVGASRNPDWGPGSVAVGALAGAHADAMPPSGLLGLVMVAVVAAWTGGWFSHLVRRANATAVEQYRSALDAGDPAALATLQRQGLLRDAMRGFAVTALALVLADIVSTLFAREWNGPQAPALVALAATSLGVALSAGSRVSGPGRQQLWFAGGLGVGTAMALMWLR
jgi:mannose/fructose/N-acetylgalactosamine-specific phosphotransferase system component IIC